MAPIPCLYVVETPTRCPLAAGAVGRRRRQPGLQVGPPCVTINTMATGSPITEVLRRAILDSGLPLLRIAQETGVERASLSRFVAGKRSLRLDMADKLAAYFGLRLTPTEAKPTRRGEEK